MQSISELPFKQVVTVGTGDGLLVDPHEHLIKMAVFIISTLALHYITRRGEGKFKMQSFLSHRQDIEGPNEELHIVLKSLRRVTLKPRRVPLALVQNLFIHARPSRRQTGREICCNRYAN